MSNNIINKISQKFKGSGFKYAIDEANSNEIAGWVFDAKHAGQPLEVQLCQGDQVVASVKADNFRQDVLDAGVGSGYCGFNFDMKSLTVSQSEAYFDLFAVGKKLNQEPIFIKFETEKPQPQPAQPVQSEALTNYRVHVDKNTPGKIVGWAIDESRPAHKPNIECKLGDAVLGTCVADRLRNDLAKAQIGDGKIAFNIDYDVAQLPDNGVGLQVIVDGVLLVDSEKNFLLSAEDIQAAKDKKQQARFVAGVKQEMTEITQQISQHNMNAGLPADSVAGVCSVFIERMAELSFRLSVMEKALAEKLTKQ